MQIQKHLGVYLDNKVNFRGHLRNIFKTVNRKISLLRKLQNNLPRAPLVKIYKSFIRSHPDYGYILMTKRLILIFMKSSNRFQRKKLSKTRLWIPSAMTVVQETCLFFRTIKNQSSMYLFELVPTARQAYMTRNKNKYSSFQC